MKLKQPSLKPYPKEEKYEVARDYIVNVDGVIIAVPKFFRYDGASIPSIAWHIIHTPFNPLVMGPALVHDWLYWNHQVEREEADDIFSNLLKMNGVSSGKRYAMWSAVRAAGKPYWENDEEDIEEMVILCNKLKSSANYDAYIFPEEVIQKCAG